MKNILVIIFFIFLFKNVYSQCAVNSPASDFDIRSKSLVSYDNSVRKIFNQIKVIYNLDCNYFYYDDSQSPNAQANPDDGNIYLGTTFLSECFQSGTNLTGIYFIVAHEMSHLWQFNHTDEWLENIDGTVRYSELQADFMAGYVLGRLGYINNNNYRQLLGQVWSMGDESWHDVGTHGTPTERVMDTHLGMTHSTESPESAFSASTSIAPPDRDRIGKMVAEIDFYNRTVLFIQYGGKVYDSYNRQVGQMTGIPNTYNFRINFTKEGWYDIIISGNYVYSLQNQIIGIYRSY